MKFTAAQLKKWQADPARFIETQLVDPVTNKPFVLLPAEREFIDRAFQIDATTGRLLYPEQVYGCPRKSGKTAFAAMMLLTMVLLFGGRFGEAYCAANDQEQAIGRVFQAVARIVECSPLLRDSEVMRDRVTFPAFGGATVAAIASDAAGAAGHNACFSTFDELWGYTSERSRRLWDEMSTSPVRKISGRLTTTYAGYEGESQLLEELYKRGLAQPKVGKDLHAGDGILMFWTHEPIAPWQSQAWLDEQRRSLRPNQYLRQIENRFVTSESTFVDIEKWDACVDAQATAFVADKNLPIWVGVDASTKHDSSAVCAVTWDQAEQKVRLVTHKVFQPSPDDPLDFEDTIETTLRDLADRFEVRKILFDPWQMQAVAQRLTRAGLPILEFPQTVSNLTAASQNLYELVEHGNLKVYADAAMRLAVSRAVAVETARGWRISKEKQSHKIDVVVALGMACHAAIEATGVRPRRGAYFVTAPHHDQPDDGGRSSLRWFGQFLKPEERHAIADQIGITPDEADKIAAEGKADVDDQVEYGLTGAEIERNRMRAAVLGPDWRSKVAGPLYDYAPGKKRPGWD
jgi:phage terminase large subunit-like protein